MIKRADSHQHRLEPASGADQVAPQGQPDAAGYAYPAGAGYPTGAGYPVSYVSPPPGRFASFVLRLWARSPQWLAPAAILACFGGAVAYVLSREPVDGALDTPTCLAKLTTGFDCPGCGGTRAFYFLVQGNLPAAARHHLVFVFAVPFLVYAYLAWAGNRIFRWQLPQLRPGPLTVGILVAALALFSLLRNLPWAPFTWFYV